LLFSCEECPGSSEPILYVELRGDTFYQSVECVGLNHSFEFDPGWPAYQPYHFSLPISMHSDSTIYLLHRAQVTDTLKIEYNRDFYFLSVKCGYCIRLKSMSISYSTIDSVEITTHNDWEFYASIK
jgi:hypothetical protein